MSKCKSCGAEVIWIVTPKGKAMPLDAKGENLWLIDGGGAGEANTTARPVQVRKSHFATCPDGDAWRKPDAT